MRSFAVGTLLSLALVAIATGSARAGEPLRFVEGPYTWDDTYPAGWLCDFPVRVQGTIEVKQTWFVSAFPPGPDEEWSTLSRFKGNETWTNLDTGAAARDTFTYNIVHSLRGIRLLKTVLTGNSTNVKGGVIVDAGRVVYLGDDLYVPAEWHGRFLQFPDPGAWYEARCASIAS